MNEVWQGRWKIALVPAVQGCGHTVLHGSPKVPVAHAAEQANKNLVS